MDPAPENDLVSTPQRHILTPTNTSETSQVRLVCGCRFPLTWVGNGDTSVIRYSGITTDSLNSHTVNVNAVTAGLASGTYTSYLALSAPDFFKVIFRDTIYDTLVVP
jgi:hypothetical protein